MSHAKPLSRLQTALNLRAVPGPATAPAVAALRYHILQDDDVLCACQNVPGGYVLTPFHRPDGSALVAVFTDRDRAHTSGMLVHPMPLLDVLSRLAMDEQLDGLLIDAGTMDLVLDRQTACDAANAALMQLMDEWDDD